MTKVREMGLNKWSEVAVALDKAKFTADFMQAIVNSPNNLLAQKMFDSVAPFVKYSTWFEIINEFGFKVPEYYDHETQIEAFKKNLGWRLGFAENNIVVDKNFSKASLQMKAGENRIVRIFRVITNRLAFMDCLDFVGEQGASCAGFQGTSLIYSLFPGCFPQNNKWIHCLDREDNLWNDPNEDSRAQLPMFLSGDMSDFNFSWIAGGVGQGDIFICII